MGEDLTGKIKEIKDGSDIPKRFHRYLELGNVKQQIDMVGPMYLVKIRGNYYLYQDQSHFYQSHNDASFGEQFMSEDGKRDRSGKILKELGLDELGLRFSDIIDIFYNEGEPLNENVEKNKKFLTNLMGVDFTDKIQQITSSYDVPMSFDEGVSPGVSPELIRRWLNHWGPMYLVNIKGKKYLYQDRGEYEFFMDEHGYDYVDDEILEQLGIDELGLKFSDIIDIFFNEEETLNEGIDMSQNLKVKKLLQNLLENKDFNISFEDEEYVYALGADYEELVYTPYEFKFHMIVKKVYGEGSNTIAKIDVIIDDIQKDNEDFYDEWVSDGYNEDVWYIEELGDKIKQELLEDLPFSIYLTFYGYDEVNSHF
jgi:antitoxin component of RelBE/YafQ-DinJ toxin-antitoxin module